MLWRRTDPECIHRDVTTAAVKMGEVIEKSPRKRVRGAHKRPPFIASGLHLSCS